MRILMLGFGAFSKVNAALVENFRKEGHEVEALLVEEKIKSFSPKNIYNLWIAFYNGGFNFKQAFIKNAYVFKRLSKYCGDYIRKNKERFDCVFQTQFFFSPNLDNIDLPYYIYTDYTMRLAEKEYPPWAPFRNKLSKEAWFCLEESAHKKARLNFVSTEYVKKSLVSHYNVADDKIVVVGIGGNMPAEKIYDKRYDKDNLLFIGIDFERKGGKVLLKAFEKVKKICSNAELFIVGCKPRIDFERVHVLGRKEGWELKELLKKASLFVMPSLAEPSAAVFAEAMAYRLPCIGTRVDGIPELIEDGRSGFLVSPNDADELAEKVITLLKDRSMMAEFGRRGFEIYEQKFRWDVVAEKILSNMKSGRLEG